MYILSKRIFIYAFFILSAVALTPIASETAKAHSGRTDSSGGHTCRTNCPSYGLEYGEYHYHGGGSPATYTPPAPKAATTWEYNGKTYYTFSAYTQAKADDEAEKERLEQEEILEEKEAEIVRLKQEQEDLQQQVDAQTVESPETNLAPTPITPEQTTAPASSGNAGLALLSLGLLGGSGIYFYRNRRQS